MSYLLFAMISSSSLVVGGCLLFVAWCEARFFIKRVLACMVIVVCCVLCVVCCVLVVVFGLLFVV